MYKDSVEHIGKSDVGKNGIRVSSNKVFSYPAHTHAFYEMTLYEPFDGVITVNSEALDMKESWAIMTAPFDFHTIDVKKGGGTFIKVAFDESIIGERCGNVCFSMKCRAGDAQVLKGMFCELLTTDDNRYAENLICAIVSYINAHGEGISVTNSGDNAKKQLLSRALGVINREFCEDITLSEVANRLGISPQYLSRVFSKTAGVTFSEYLCGLRLRYAAQLIREDGMGITGACFSCGYRNLSHFLRSFKRMYGISPGEMRAKEKAQDKA